MEFNNYIHRFKGIIKEQRLPESFTYPFYYSPHPLVTKAAKELQSYLQTQKNWIHNFGLDAEQKGTVIGKMFGVMVVKDQSGSLGFIAAFSGKLADKNDIPGFVPPIYDMLDPKGYYKIEESNIDEINKKIDELESDTLFVNLVIRKNKAIIDRDEIIAQLKSQFNKDRKERRSIRKSAIESKSKKEFEILHEQHKQLSLGQQHQIKKVAFDWNQKIESIDEALDQKRNQILLLKSERKQRSNALQKWLFEQYNFLNAKGEIKNVVDIFESTALGVPPAGAGECAAPKLLQFAYQNRLTPICFGEFWWGQPPKSEIRKHATFYPSCRGKCEPILSHMLKGLNVDNNPIDVTPETEDIKTIYEDDAIVVINKPPELLSVPGKSIQDSVYLRMRQRINNLASPLIVHRLDMSTSGLMIIAKTKASHKFLQREFLKREVEKKYIALLDGILRGSEGVVSLPLRLDYINRPQQCVCFESGKQAKTIWSLLSIEGDKSRVEFKPVTGRTHQLRVHSAHKDGLNIPIVGDDLYGIKSNRLHLHSAYIKFKHPISKEMVEFESKPEF